MAPRMVTSMHVTVFVWPVSVIVEPESEFQSLRHVDAHVNQSARERVRGWGRLRQTADLMVPSSWPVSRNSHRAEWCRHEISERLSVSVARHAMSYVSHARIVPSSDAE